MRRTITAAAISGLLLVAAGCGSDSQGGVSAGESQTDSVPTASAPAATADTASDETVATDAPATDPTGSSAEDTSPELPDLSIPTDITFPDLNDITVPAGLSDECTELYTLFTTALTSIMTGGDEGEAAAQRLSEELVDRVPPELEDDAQVLADGFAKISAVLARFDGDMTKVFSDPEALAELEALSSEEFTQASDNLTAYFETECPFD